MVGVSGAQGSMYVHRRCQSWPPARRLRCASCMTGTWPCDWTVRRWPLHTLVCVRAVQTMHETTCKLSPERMHAASGRLLLCMRMRHACAMLSAWGGAGYGFATTFLRPTLWTEPFPASVALEPVLPEDGGAVGFREVPLSEAEARSSLTLLLHACNFGFYSVHL